MSELRILAVSDGPAADDWRHVHNVIIPADALSADEVRERIGRNRLHVAYRGDTLVGCTTVRPGTTATVIVRVLPEYRRQGIGRQLHAMALAEARSLAAERIETVVWASNVDGLRFAAAHGYVDEVDRYLPDGEDVPYVTLRRA
ncbi:GNAT family N-acetyltransferase [Dactylosporangium sp. NPDC005572]|uniref:GNAT family N-acetyltransferase n=1 Tax=Dactylosporangium sp. NPDC005572 TaxID=3156889 RepID=UPI0033B15646